VNTLSEVSRKDLRPFFDAWFKTYTLPKVKVTQHIERVEDKYLLKLHISQQGKLFIFPLWVGWSENGKNVRKMIVVDKREHTAQFELTRKPKRIQINPDNAVPGKFY
jgi:aminopeptidase N